jgi:peroxiredoxin
LQQVHGQVKDLGGSIIAISPQLNKYTKQVVKKHGLTFPVLADKDNQYAAKLGLSFTLPEKLKELYLGFGIDLPRFNGNETWQLPMPARFLVDTSGVIRSTEVHADHTIRPEPAEIVDFVRSLG